MNADISNILLISLLLTAAYFDVTEKRIPNLITFPTVILGLLLNIIMYGLNGVVISISGLLVGMAVFFIPFAFGVMGAGDVKFMAAIGAIMGWKFTILSAIFSAAAGMFVAIGYLIYKKELFSYIKKLIMFILKSFIKIILKYIYFDPNNKFGNKIKKFAYFKEEKVKEKNKLYVPYGLAITLGTLFLLSGIINIEILL